MFEQRIKLIYRLFVANIRYIKRPFFDFVPLLLVLVVILIAGGISFKNLYEQEPLSFVRALYITFCLIFLEHVLPFPDHWLLQFFYFLLPILGLVVVIDGISRFAYHVFRRDNSGQEWVRAMSGTLSNHVILVGLGRVGIRTLEQLVRLKEDVIVLEKDPENPNIRFAKRHHFPVLIGSGREEGILDDLNIKNAKSIILATNDDLANLELTIDARNCKPGIRVVLRLFDQELASKITETMNVDIAFSTAALAAPLVATSSSDRSISNAFFVGDLLVVVAKLTVHENSGLRGKRIGQLGREHQAFFLSIERGTDETPFPGADTEVFPGDRLTVQCEPRTLKAFHQLNCDPIPY